MTQQFDGQLIKTDQDLLIERLIEKHCDVFVSSPLEAVKLFPVLARRQWLKRFFAHSDLFRQTLTIPGDVVEFGVFRGLSLFTWANILECYCIGDRTKVVYGFDNWEGFVKLHPIDGLVEEEKRAGGFCSSIMEIEDALTIFDRDRFISQKPRIRLIKGDICKTAPEFMEKNPGVRFSFVHFDCDLYEPTKAAFNAVFPRVVRGGIVVFDEYSIPHWAGETKAVDEFLEDFPNIMLRKLPYTNSPAAYFVKP